MKKSWISKSLLIFSVFAWLLVLTVSWVSADEGKRLKANLSGFQEPPSVSTTATGTFEATVTDTSITYKLSYSGLEGALTQAHIHFGQRGVNGGISVFLCTNLGNAPTTVPTPQACLEPTAGTITGTITAADVFGPGTQGIAAMEFSELVRAIRTGHAYVNLHTTKFAGGEIRGQLEDSDSGDRE
jgi:hypothetical protein